MTVVNHCSKPMSLPRICLNLALTIFSNNSVIVVLMSTQYFDACMILFALDILWVLEQFVDICVAAFLEWNGAG